MAAGYLCSCTVCFVAGSYRAGQDERAQSTIVGEQVRRIYGASMSPDATAFAHLVDDGGYPRAVQRFLRGWRASSSRDVELPVEGPVTRVMHSADGHWLACQVAPEGGTRSQIWVVTTDPDDRDARRIDFWPSGVEGTAELIGWDGTQVATQRSITATYWLEGLIGQSRRSRAQGGRAGRVGCFRRRSVRSMRNAMAMKQRA